MSFVDAFSATRLDFLPQAVSDVLLQEHAVTIQSINDHLNSGVRDEQRTESIVKILNDRIGKDVTQAHIDHGFPSIDTLTKLGMLRMSYVPDEHKGTVELLYRTMLLGALMEYAERHPAYRLEAQKQRKAHESGLIDAYARMHGGDKEAGVDFVMQLQAQMESGRGHSR